MGFSTLRSSRLPGMKLWSRPLLAGGWGLQGAAQWIHGRSEGGDALADIPPRSLRVQISKRISESAEIQFRSFLFDRDNRPGPVEVATPGYFRLDLLGRVRFSRLVSVVGQMRNLLDKDYPASPDVRATQAPGRWGALTVLFDL